jgi:hypothetical protein
VTQSCTATPDIAPKYLLGESELSILEMANTSIEHRPLIDDVVPDHDSAVYNISMNM